MLDIELLKIEVEKLLGFHLSGDQLEVYQVYAKELADWNRKINLTGIRDPSDVRRKHFVDSLSCLLAVGENSMGKVVDVGSGAGFPGLPLRIAKSEINLTLVESRKKKAEFIAHIVQVLRLENVEVLPERVEKIGQMQAYRAQFDWGIARLVARLPVLLEYMLPLVKVGGYVLAQKGKEVDSEIASAQNALAILGAEIKEVIPVKIPGLEDQRHLVLIKKVAATPEKYPRREGVPAKQPL